MSLNKEFIITDNYVKNIKILMPRGKHFGLLDNIIKLMHNIKFKGKPYKYMIGCSLVDDIKLFWKIHSSQVITVFYLNHKKQLRFSESIFEDPIYMLLEYLEMFRLKYNISTDNISGIIISDLIKKCKQNELIPLFFSLAKKTSPHLAAENINKFLYKLNSCNLIKFISYLKKFKQEKLLKDIST